jgi:UDP-GlcNAc:undecaprenyl-phosphate GlcNAc-1-phosphate transferase
VFIQVLTASLLTAICLLVLAPFARRLGIVDRPDARKQHGGEVPLIGGLAIFITIVTLLPLFSPLDANLLWYLAASFLLVLFGVLDDRFNLSVSLRVAVEIVAALMMILGAGLWVGDLGNLLGFRDLHMPLWLSLPFTIIAVFGITNAWNMIDGMDGLVGSVTLIGLGSFYFISHGTAGNNSVTALLIGATAAFLLFNLCSNRLLPKVFLGDAGSKFIGFSLVWLLIDATQAGPLTGLSMPAVLALFVVGLPLIDMVSTTVRRMRRGLAPFNADRTHVHHILLHAGFTKEEVLLLVALACMLINLIGATLFALSVPDWAMFLVFWCLTFLYLYYIDHPAVLGRWLLGREGR